VQPRLSRQTARADRSAVMPARFASESLRSYCWKTSTLAVVFPDPASEKNCEGEIM